MDELFGDKPRDDVRYEYHQTEVKGLDLLSRDRNASIQKVAEHKIRDLERTKGRGWELYCILPATPFQATSPILVFRKARTPGSDRSPSA